MQEQKYLGRLFSLELLVFVIIYSAVARGGAGGARAPPVFFPKKVKTD